MTCLSILAAASHMSSVCGKNWYSKETFRLLLKTMEQTQGGQLLESSDETDLSAWWMGTLVVYVRKLYEVLNFLSIKLSDF